jgi:hypothetical protein
MSAARDTMRTGLDSVTDWLEDKRQWFEDTVLSKHSYGTHLDRDDVFSDMYKFHEPDEGWTQLEYGQEMQDIIEDRKERLEDLPDGTVRRWIQAADIQFTHSFYLGGRFAGMAVGGWGIVHGDDPGRFMGTLAIAGSVIGLNFTGEIRKYTDDDFVEGEIELYNEALDELEEEIRQLEEDPDYVASIPTPAYSGTRHAPPRGSKAVEFYLEDGEYHIGRNGEHPPDTPATIG